MERRAFVVCTLGLLAGPLAAEAQAPARAPRVGALGATPSDPALVQAFAHGLASAGYVDGRNLAIEHRHAQGQLGILG
jgi:putative ABC transport system substrate-binding protein